MSSWVIGRFWGFVTWFTVKGFIWISDFHETIDVHLKHWFLIGENWRSISNLVCLCATIFCKKIQDYKWGTEIMWKNDFWRWWKTTASLDRRFYKVPCSVWPCEGWSTGCVCVWETFTVRQNCLNAVIVCNRVCVVCSESKNKWSVGINSFVVEDPEETDLHLTLCLYLLCF